MGVLVGAVQQNRPLAGSLALVGAIFVLLQVLGPIHQAIGANLGDRTAAWLYDRLTDACVRPPGMGHLEDPTLTSDLTVARDFDLGMTGPPLSFSMDFIATGLVQMIAGVASAVILARYAWWAPMRARGRLAGDALASARECDLARPQHRRGARRAARCRLRLPAGGGRAREQGVAAVRPRRLDDRPFHRSTHAPARASVRRHSSARASAHLEPAPRRLGKRRRLLVPGERRRRWPHQSRGNHRLRAERHRRVGDRVRRIQLGARRIGGSCRRGAATRAGDASRRRAALWQPPRRRHAGARDSSP